MSVGYSVVIEDRTKENRILFFKLKYYLELCGYTVLEDRNCLLHSADGCYFTRIILYGEDKPAEDGNEGVWCLHAANIGDVLDSLCQQVKENEEDYAALQRIRGWYTESLFRHLYTIGYLYANRYSIYKDKMLLGTARELAGICDEKERYLEANSYSWREEYAYLYMVNRVNEAIYKMRGLQYYPYNMLRWRIDELKRKQRKNREAALLEAEIIRNAEMGITTAMEAFKKLENSSSYGVRFWALYAMGELERERADEEYSRWEHADQDCQIQVRLNETAMGYFERALQLKTDEPRILFKLGVHNEKKGLTVRNKQKEASEQFRMIIKEIEGIPIAQRTTLEFEYLYKTYLRLGHTLKQQRIYEDARQQYRKAEEIWKDLGQYRLFDEIYGSGAEAIRGILDLKYAERAKTLAINRAEIDQLENRK